MMTSPVESVVVSAAPIYPATTGATTRSSGLLDMSVCHGALFVGLVGETGTGTTIYAYLSETDDPDGTGATPITGAAIATITSASSKAFKIAVPATAVSKRYVRGTLVVGTSTASTGALLMATSHRYGPGSDVSAVVQSVTP